MNANVNCSSFLFYWYRP